MLKKLPFLSLVPPICLCTSFKLNLEDSLFNPITCLALSRIRSPIPTSNPIFLPAQLAIPLSPFPIHFTAFINTGVRALNINPVPIPTTGPSIAPNLRLFLTHPPTFIPAPNAIDLGRNSLYIASIAACLLVTSVSLPFLSFIFSLPASVPRASIIVPNLPDIANDPAAIAPNKIEDLGPNIPEDCAIFAVRAPKAPTPPICKPALSFLLFFKWKSIELVKNSFMDCSPLRGVKLPPFSTYLSETS